ncbi:MAG: DUF134 domain-containing protein [Candidatus Omnitrophota bacterium]
MTRGRPIKPRVIRTELKVKQFSPRGRIGRPGNIELKTEEAEAIRFSDHMGLSQKEAAGFMGISQQTFSRVLKSGRKRLAEALVMGHIIKVRGGSFRVEK